MANRTTKPFVLRITDRAEPLDVVRFSGREAINSPYRFAVDVLAEGELAPDGLLGKAATLEIRTSHEVRLVHGVVTSGDVSTPHQDGRSAGRIRLEPRLATLRYASGYRIFHDQTVIEVVTRVLADHQILVSFRASRAYERRAHRIQRGERDLAFLDRILADDGLFYWFEQTEESELLIIADSSSAYDRLPGSGRLRHLADPTAAVADDQTILGLSARSTMRPAHLVARRYEHAKPKLGRGDATHEPLADESIQRASPRAGVTYAHDHSVEGMSVALRPSRDRHEAATALARRAQGTTLYPHMAPGLTFGVEDHAESSLNAEYVAMRVEHAGVSPEGAAADRAYQATVTSVPRDTPLRPAPKRPALSRGLETATVMGPVGDEIHTDREGRIQVRFHWDLETELVPRTTAWLRVAQAWAGPSYGASFTPRVGNEVLVGFIDGDPDRPIVVGSVHNAKNPTPWSFPHDKTKSGIVSRSSPLSGNGNELTFQDRAGEELVSIRAAKALAITSVADAQLTVGRNFEQIVAGESTETITGPSRLNCASDRVEAVGVNHSLSVGAQSTVAIAGNHIQAVGGLQQLLVEGRQHAVVGLGRLTSIGKDREHADDQLSITGSYTVGAGLGITLTGKEGVLLRCGESEIHLLPDKIVLSSPTLELKGSKGLSLIHEDGENTSGLVMNGSATLTGKTVGVESSQGGKLLLDSEAKLNASLVKLNCGEKQGPPETEEDDDAERDAVFELPANELPPDVTEVILLIATPTGEIREERCAAGGKVTLKGRRGEKFVVRGMRVGDRTFPVFPAQQDEKEA